VTSSSGRLSPGPGGSPGVTTAVDGTQATLVLVAYLVAFTVVAAVLLHRGDVT
jgi:hypothetical protein